MTIAEFRCLSRLLAVAVVVVATVAGSASALDCNLVFPNKYFMVEGVGDESIQYFNLWLSATATPSVVPAGSAISVQASCANAAKVINFLQPNGQYAAFSNTVGDTGFHEIKFMSDCVHEVLFNIRRKSDFTYEVQDDDGNCLAIGNDTTVNVVTLVSCVDRSVVLAHALKNFSEFPITTPEKAFPYASFWDATQIDTTMQNIILPAMMSIKDNNGMTCTVTSPPGVPAPAPTNGLSSAAVIVIAVLISGFAAVGVYLGMRRFFKRQDYAEMRVAINEHHEA